jgi:hypothetical protein
VDYLKSTKNVASKPLFEVLVVNNDGGANIKFYEVLTDSKEIKMLLGDETLAKLIQSKDINESKTFQVQNIRDTVSGFFNDTDKIAKLTTDAARTGNLDVKTLMDSFFGEGETSKLKDFGEEAKKAVEGIATKLVGSIKELASKSDVAPPPRGTRGPNSSEPVTTGGISVGGLGGSNGNGGTTTNPRFNRPITNRSADVNFDGGIDVNVKFDNIPVGFTPQQKDEATKMIADAFARLDFNKMIKEIVKNDDAIPRSSNRSSN